MAERSVGSIGNRLGLYTVTVYEVRRFLRRPYFTVGCDNCAPVRTWNRTSDLAWQQARKHADFHQAAINAQLGLPWPPAQRSAEGAPITEKEQVDG